MGGGRCDSLHGSGKGVDSCTKVNSDVTEPGELADAAMLELGFHEIVSGEVVGDAERVESISTNIAIKVRGVREPWESLRLICSKASGSTACVCWGNRENVGDKLLKQQRDH